MKVDELRKNKKYEKEMGNKFIQFGRQCRPN